MSKIEISFHLIKCAPSINYTNYVYTIYCEETKFNDTITFQAHNTIKDQLTYKTDLKYSLKAYNNGDLIGVASFELLSELFYRKETKCLKNLRLTVPERVRQALIKETSESQMSVKLLITFTYTEKKIKKYFMSPSSMDRTVTQTESSIAKYKRQAPNQSLEKKKKANVSTADSKKETDVVPLRSSSVNKKMMNKSQSINSCNSQLDKINANEEEDSLLLSNDNSLIDSLIGRDDISFSSEDEYEKHKQVPIEKQKSIKKKLSFESKAVPQKKEVDSYSKEEFKDKFLELFSKFAYDHKVKATRLKKALEEEEKMKECYKKYNEKYRNVLKKEHKLIHSNDIYEMKKKIITDLNREMHDIKREAMTLKQIELDICLCLLKDVGIRKREEDFSEENSNEKEFLMKIFDKLHKGDVNISSYLSDTKRSKLDHVCDKYNIKVNVNRNAKITSNNN